MDAHAQRGMQLSLRQNNVRRTVLFFKENQLRVSWENGIRHSDQRHATQQLRHVHAARRAQVPVAESILSACALGCGRR
jgi:hypothetical protein